MLTTIIIIIVLFFIFVITYLVSNYLLTRSTHFWRAFPVEPAVVYMKLFWLSAGSFTCCTPLQKTFWVKVLGNTFKRRQVWVLSYVEWFCTFCGQIEKKKHCSWCFQQSTSRQNICIYITFLTLNHSKSPCQFLGQPWSQHLMVKIRIYFI